MADPSPFERMGGGPAVAALVNAFYDQMEANPAYAELREMHASDLQPMRVSLAAFLSGWLGGPRDWFDRNPGKCMMSLHSGLPITEQTARQWIDAMNDALKAQPIEPAFAEALGNAFRNLAQGMVRRLA